MKYSLRDIGVHRDGKKERGKKMEEKWEEKRGNQDEQWKNPEENHTGDWEKQEKEREGQIKDWENQEKEHEGQIKNWEKQEKKHEGQIKNWEGQEKERERQIGSWEEREEKRGTREETGRRQEFRTEEEDAGKKGRTGKKFHLTGSLPAKIIVFFVLAISCFVGMLLTILCIHLESEEFYTKDLNTVLAGTLRGVARDTIYDVEPLLVQGQVKAAEDLCRNRNIDIELLSMDEDGSLNAIWSTWDGQGTALTGEIYSAFDEGQIDREITINGYTLKSDVPYLYRYYIDPKFPIQDECQEIARLVTFLYNVRFALIGLAVGGLFLCLVSFIFLICSAGHRNGQEGIIPGVLTGIHLDVLTLFFAGGVSGLGAVIVELVSYMGDLGQVIILTVAGSLLAVWGTLYCMDFALRIKLGKCWRHTLIYVILRGIGRVLRFLCRGIGALIRGIPLILTVLTVYFGICILEFMGVALFMRTGEGFLLWALEKAVLLVVVAYIALTCNRLLTAGRALAEGEEGYTVDTSRMFGDFKEHGENLNSLSQGISRAVAERMKSEHLKTELISNVSHDIKTPLTSIINYADLICEETGRGETADISRLKEFSEVLLRQSRRLKKLLEDLMEASKATTGNLEVNLETCEVGVLLSQAVGEYQQRMEEKGLELITRKPQEEVRILADGRHLWRVFDNLLNNICKYAQENSRVYLSIETDGEWARIIFRNMSKYPLDISPEELQERFVRGDKSRHMEGNGLGLSIARSLVELQNGEMDIIIDGDLFKVTVGFPL